MMLGDSSYLNEVRSFNRLDAACLLYEFREAMNLQNWETAFKVAALYRKTAPYEFRVLRPCPVIELQDRLRFEGLVSHPVFSKTLTLYPNF